jgi:hypothetical protein
VSGPRVRDRDDFSEPKPRTFRFVLDPRAAAAMDNLFAGATQKPSDVVRVLCECVKIVEVDQ